MIGPSPFIEAFLVIIALALALAWFTEAWGEQSLRGEYWQETMEWLPVPMMDLTLFVVISSQLPRVQESIGQIIAVVPVYVAFLIIMPLLGRLTAGFFRIDVGESRVLVFTSVTRNSLVVLPVARWYPQWSSPRRLSNSQGGYSDASSASLARIRTTNAVFNPY